MKEAAVEVVVSGRYIMGPAVADFEAAAADYLGAKFAIGVSNGTDALRASLAVLAARRGPGKVATTPFTFIATAEAIKTAGLEVVFVDVDPGTGLLDLELLEEQMSPHMVGVVPVHLFGQCVPMSRLMALAASHDLWVVEDAAQSFGARVDGKMSGTIGALGCYSFFPSKNLGAAGDAGLIVTDDEELASWCRASRVHGVLTRKYYSDFLSGNYRLDALQAAILLAKLPHVDSWNRARQQVARRYEELFAAAGLLEAGEVRLFREEPESTHVYHQFVVLARRRDQLLATLREADIGCAVYYPAPLHLQKAFAYLGHRPQDFPVSMELSESALALPVFPGLTESEQGYVVETIARFFGRKIGLAGSGGGAS